MPAYIGSGQPQAAKSALSGLTSWFGAEAPVYKPSPNAAPAATPSASSGWSTSATAANQPQVIAIVVPRGFLPAWDCPDPQQ